jgi:hypothetical protein
MHVPTSETYAEVRNLGVKEQDGVGWYVAEYTSIPQYIAGCTSIPDPWSAFRLCTLVLSLLTAGYDVKCMGGKCMHAQTSDRYAEKSRCSWLCTYGHVPSCDAHHFNIPSYDDTNMSIDVI